MPLDFEIGENANGIIITGPNTGGKTVCIKTVGLFCLMAQCGLHVPAENADICMNNEIFCDIGDGQDINQNLSTFSGCTTTLSPILKLSALFEVSLCSLLSFIFFLELVSRISSAPSNNSLSISFSLYEYLYAMKYKKKFNGKKYPSGIPKDQFEQLIMEYLPVSREDIEKYRAN